MGIEFDELRKALASAIVKFIKQPPLLPHQRLVYFLSAELGVEVPNGEPGQDVVIK